MTSSPKVLENLCLPKVTYSSAADFTKLASQGKVPPSGIGIIFKKSHEVSTTIYFCLVSKTVVNAETGKSSIRTKCFTLEESFVVSILSLYVGGLVTTAIEKARHKMQSLPPYERATVVYEHFTFLVSVFSQNRFPSNTSDEAKETHQDTTQAIIPTALHSRVMASVFPDAGSDIRQACIYRALAAFSGESEETRARAYKMMELESRSGALPLNRYSRGYVAVPQGFSMRNSDDSWDAFAGDVDISRENGNL